MTDLSGSLARLIWSTQWRMQWGWSWWRI